MAKTSDQILAEAAKLRRKAREAERSEMEAFGRWTAERFGGDVKGASSRIAVARQALDEVLADRETEDTVAHDTVPVAHEEEGNRDVMTSLFANVDRGSLL